MRFSCSPSELYFSVVSALATAVPMLSRAALHWLSTRLKTVPHLLEDLGSYSLREDLSVHSVECVAVTRVARSCTSTDASRTSSTYRERARMVFAAVAETAKGDSRSMECGEKGALVPPF